MFSLAATRENTHRGSRSHTPALRARQPAPRPSLALHWSRRLEVRGRPARQPSAPDGPAARPRRCPTSTVIHLPALQRCSPAGRFRRRPSALDGAIGSSAASAAGQLAQGLRRTDRPSSGPMQRAWCTGHSHSSLTVYSPLALVSGSPWQSFSLVCAASRAFQTLYLQRVFFFGAEKLFSAPKKLFFCPLVVVRIGTVESVEQDAMARRCQSPICLPGRGDTNELARATAR